MNALDILKYGHFTVLGSVKDLPEADWQTGGVCGVWSVKQIIAHLASFEQLLVEILENVSGSASGPVLERYKADILAFNDEEVTARQNLNAAQTMAEYETLQAQTMPLLAQIPAAQRRENGLLPWYGAEYDLDDFLVYTYYGHKREHCAQIAVFRDQIKR
ncbi:MAG: maleylpyruvate isomerase N-terminal domain-containing protein [Anaerolineae bacterium]|nr:maleylpyruvate isomerase N-terminal domain-containing protein [Anaerolineae bacterium]